MGRDPQMVASQDRGGVGQALFGAALRRVVEGSHGSYPGRKAHSGLPLATGLLSDVIVAKAYSIYTILFRFMAEKCVQTGQSNGPQVGRSYLEGELFLAVRTIRLVGN